MGKQKVRWRQSSKSGFSYKRAYHKKWREWQKAVKAAQRLDLPIPPLEQYVDKADYTVRGRKTSE
ncbi:MAG TPA: hypothetical protein VKT82_15665 [Ktedonobacterales bacterium]|nr:hypothetical protein [Ktedonobacterales bacterium]